MSQPYANFESEQSQQNPQNQHYTPNPQQINQAPVQGIPIITSQIQNAQVQMQPNQQVVIIQQVPLQQQQVVDQPNTLLKDASQKQKLLFIRMVTLIWCIQYLIALIVATLALNIPNIEVFYFDEDSCSYTAPTYILLFCYTFLLFWIRSRYVLRERVTNAKRLFLIQSLMLGVVVSPFYSTLISFGNSKYCLGSLLFGSAVFLLVWQGFLLVAIFYIILLCSPTEGNQKDLLIRFLIPPIAISFICFLSIPYMLFFIILTTMAQIPFLIQLSKVAHGERGKLRSEQYIQGYIYCFGYSLLPWK